MIDEKTKEVLSGLIYHGRGKFSPKRDAVVLKKAVDGLKKAGWVAPEEITEKLVSTKQLLSMKFGDTLTFVNSKGTIIFKCVKTP